MANAAFLSALTVFLLVGWIAGELRFLAPYKTILFREHAALIGVAALLLFLNLTRSCNPKIVIPFSHLNG